MQLWKHKVIYLVTRCFNILLFFTLEDIN